MHWLSTHRATAVASALATFAAVVFFHDPITVWATAQFHKIGRDAYNQYAEYAFGGLLVPLVAAIGWLILKNRHNQAAILLFTIHIFLIALGYRYLVTFNIEFVHFFAYLLIALLLLPACRSVGETVIWTTLLGALDELYQYLVLNPDYGYYDFNDVLLNLIGAGVGTVLALLGGNVLVNAEPSAGRVSVAVYVALSIPILVLVGWKTGWIAMEPMELKGGHPFFTFIRKAQPPGFWTEAYPGRVFHIVKPLEGAMAIFLFFGAFLGVDRWWLKQREAVVAKEHP